jgi:hypothetical protein
MAMKVKNCTKQIIPIIIGEQQIVLQPLRTVVLAIDKPTQQMKTLKSKGKIKIQ